MVPLACAHVCDSHGDSGQLCNQLIGQEEGCPHVSEREEDFFVLGLDVKGKRSILESLQLYVEGEVRGEQWRTTCGSLELLAT